MAPPVRSQVTEPTGQQEQGSRQQEQGSPGDLGRLRSQRTRLADIWDEVPFLLFDGGALEGGTRAFTPPADVEETDDAYVVELELPGVKKSDIDISLSGRRLIVTGERKEKERTGVLRRRARSVGRFYYEIVLPQAVGEDAVSANLDEGVVTIRISKQDGERPHKIKVD